MNNININTDTLRRALDGNEEAREEVRAMLPTPRPTTNLLGRWAKHPEHGDVLVINDKAGLDGMVAVAFRDAKWARGARANTVPFDELAFPGQATRPEEVPPGEPWLLEVDGMGAIGCRNDPQDSLCWTVVYQDDGAHDYLFDSDVTLVARLVPEATGQDDVPEFDPAYTYRDKDGDKWGYVAGVWRLGGDASRRPHNTPPRRYGPYTRIEKENDHDH